MKTITTNRRKDVDTRAIFNHVIKELQYILLCYEAKYHYKVVNDYLNVHSLFKDNLSIKGRIYIILDVI